MKKKLQILVDGSVVVKNLNPFIHKTVNFCEKDLSHFFSTKKNKIKTPNVLTSKIKFWY